MEEQNKKVEVIDAEIIDTETGRVIESENNNGLALGLSIAIGAGITAAILLRKKLSEKRQEYRYKKAKAIVEDYENRKGEEDEYDD